MGFDTSYILNKQLPVDVQGRLAENTERASLIGAHLKTEYYNNGVEEKAIVEGYTYNNGTVVKEAEYISLKVLGNPTTSAIKSIVTNESIDLTGINWIELDFEMTGTVGYNTSAYLAVSTSKLLSYTDYAARKTISITNGVAINRSVVKLNVAALTGVHYIRLHVTDASTVVDIPAEIKVYAISALNKTFISPGIQALNQSGSLVQLTAELDDNGKAVLRIIDAAPAGYDPARDSVRTSAMPIKRKKQMQVVLANMPIGDTDILVYSALNTLAKVTSISFSIGGVAAPASSGTHGVAIYDKSVSTTNLLYSMSTTYWDNLQLLRTYKAAGTEDSGTSYAILQQIINTGLFFGDNTSADNPLIIRYKNNSNAIRTNTAYVLINYIEESIG